MSIFNLRKGSGSPKPLTPTAQNPVGEDTKQKNSEEEKDIGSKAQSQTAAHIVSYPLIRETLDVVEAIPGIRVLKVTSDSITDPIVGFLFSNGYIQPIVKTVDDFGNQALGTMDSFIPSIKTTGYGEVGELIKAPFVYTQQTVKAVAVASTDAFDVNILEPSKKLVHDTREYYNKNIYDTKGKPLLRSSVDPIFKPINKTVEDFMQSNLPEGEPITTQFSSEIEKNILLTWDLKKRSIPVITGKINDVIMAPCNYTKHALDVFNDNLNKQEKKSISTSIAATYNSSVDLAEEAWNKVLDTTWNKVFTKKASIAENSTPNELTTEGGVSNEALIDERVPVGEAKA